MSSHAWTVAAYLFVAAVLIAVELAARLRFGRWPTLGAVIRRATRHRAARFGLVLAWWWIGWHFFGG